MTNPASPNISDTEWQRRYKALDTPWDKGEAAPPLLDFLKEKQISGRVLVPGCGRGHDVRALATVPEILPVGLDLAPAAINQAQELAAAAGSQAQFHLGDFLELAPEWQQSFDWLVEHTCFCAILPEQRPAYVRSAAAALVPNGQFFGIFYLEPGVENGPPFGVSRAELLAHFSPNFSLEKEWVPGQSYPGREERELAMLWRKTR